MARVQLLMAALISASALTACSTNTKGSWACDAAQGSSCASIAQIDSLEGPPAEGKHKRNQPVVDGAGVVRWWTQEDARAGELIGGPRREGDQIIRVVVAPWIDAVGDYHGLSDVYGVMRKGGWWISPPISPLTPLPSGKVVPVDSAEAAPPPPPPPPPPQAEHTAPTGPSAKEG